MEKTEKNLINLNIDFSITCDKIHDTGAAKGRMLQMMLFSGWTTDGMKLAMNLLRLVPDNEWCCYDEDTEYMVASMVATNNMGAPPYVYAYVCNNEMHVNLIGDIREVSGETEIERLALTISNCTQECRTTTDEDVIDASLVSPCDAADAKTPIAQWAIDSQGKQVVLK